jgi:hypothetical protein
VPAAELLGNRCNEPLVEALAGRALPGEGFVALAGRGLRDRRGVYDQPEPQKPSEGLGQELELAVLTLPQPLILVDGLSEPVEGARRGSTLARVFEVSIDGVLNDRALRASGCRAVREQARSNCMV